MFERLRNPEPSPDFNDEKQRRRSRITTVSDAWGKHKKMLKRRKKKGYSVAKQNSRFSRLKFAREHVGDVLGKCYGFRPLIMPVP